MTFFRYFLLSLILVAANFVHAAELCGDVEAKVYDEFKRAYYNENHGYDYFPGFCSMNINSLNKRFKDARIDVSKAEVLYIFKRSGNASIYPQQSRSWAGDGWSFHVVMNVSGLILDMDYAAQPTLTKIEDYFRDMFLNGEGVNEDLLIKSIGARSFLTEYSGEFAQYPRSFVNPKTDSLYPPQTLKEYLSRYLPKICE